MMRYLNISHSEQLVVYGLRRNYEIGVDIEYIREIDDLEAIARQFFSPAEFRELIAAPECDRTKTFFDCWTRKEAFIKFLGTGLSLPLNRFDVSLAPGDQPRRVQFDGQGAHSWFTQDIAPSPEYAAAVAYEGLNHDLRVWKLEKPEDVVYLFQ